MKVDPAGLRHGIGIKIGGGNLASGPNQVASTQVPPEVRVLEREQTEHEHQCQKPYDHKQFQWVDPNCKATPPTAAGTSVYRLALIVEGGFKSLVRRVLGVGSVHESTTSLSEEIPYQELDGYRIIGRTRNPS